MKEIKEKPKMQTAKVLDAASRVPRTVNRAMAKAREQTENSEQYESPADYASEHIAETGRQALSDTARAADNTAHNIKQIKEQTQNGVKENHYGQTEETFRQNHSTEVYRRNYTQTPKGTAKDTVSSLKQTQRTAKTAGKTVKTAQKTVKAAQKTAKTVEKTAKTAEKTAKAAKEAAEKAAQAAAKAAKTIAEAIERAVQAFIAAMEKLIAAIAAGGWVAVVIIIAIVLIGFIIMSCFGVFASTEAVMGDPDPDHRTVAEVVAELDTEYRTSIETRLEELKKGHFDEIVVHYSGDIEGDSDYEVKWNDVIAVYSVYVTMYMQDPQLVSTGMDQDHDLFLKYTFLDMNKVEFDHKAEISQRTVKDENGVERDVIYTKLIINVNMTSMDYLEAADYYDFDANQREALEAMMAPEMMPMYAELLGIDVYDGANMTQIISGLPANAKGSEVVKAALTKLGSPYVMGAKGDRRFDCSGLAYWSVNQVDPALGKKLYTSAAGQAKYCYDRHLTVGESELLPGDLIFWQNLGCTGCGRWNEVHHVGIYIGDGKAIEASSSKGRVVIRDLWSSKNYPLFMFARPYS